MKTQTKKAACTFLRKSKQAPNFETCKTGFPSSGEEYITKDIKESFYRLGLERGPWSSWLTLFEAKRRFPHAEEIAGSNPAGPTSSSFL